MYKVLIVDDSPADLNLAVDALMAEGIDVLFAESGTEGIEVLKENSGINAVICDYNMPSMNGHQFVKQLDVLEENPHVILSSSDNDPRWIKDSKVLGVKAWIVKPLVGKCALKGIAQLVTGA